MHLGDNLTNEPLKAEEKTEESCELSSPDLECTMCLSVLEMLDKNLEIDSESTAWITIKLGAGIASGTSYRERLVATKVKHGNEFSLKDAAALDIIQETHVAPILESMGASGKSIDMLNCTGPKHHHQHFHVSVK